MTQDEYMYRLDVLRVAQPTVSSSKGNITHLSRPLLNHQLTSDRMNTAPLMPHLRRKPHRKFELT